MDLCYKTSDNKYSFLPPKMSDGRHFTDYRSNCEINNLLISNNKVHNSHDYKKFLLDNSQKLRELNWNYACQKNCYKKCVNPVDIPFKNEFKCNKEICKKSLVNKNGIGLRINSGSTKSLYNDNYSCINNLSPKNKCETPQNSFNLFINK
jgi:hypothetical protein